MRSAVRPAGVWGYRRHGPSDDDHQLLRLDVEDIAYVCEVPGSDKIGHYIPGTRIPVVDERDCSRTKRTRSCSRGISLT
jgi:hypothetical protein